MPRKQNGFGNPKSFAPKAVKGFDQKLDRGRGPSAAGQYPSDRRYGTSVQRTIIERYNLESDWIRWRKGYEYYAQATFEALRQYNQVTQTYQDSVLETKLYQGTPYEVDVRFTGQRYATKDSDSNNHYVVKRETTSVCELFKVNEVLDLPEARENAELWVKGTLGPDGKLLLHMTGERLTDGETTGALSYVLDAKQLPAQYIGKTLPDGMASVSVSVPLAQVEASQFVQDNGGNIRSLIGEIGYVRDFFVEKSFDLVDEAVFVDDSFYWSVKVHDQVPQQEFKILDKETDFAPSIYDIDNLTTIFSTEEADYELDGTYTFKKDVYQRFYGDQYLTAQLVEEQVTEVSYSVMPFEINDLKVVGDQVIFSSLPFLSTFNLYTFLPAEISGDQSITLVFSDYGFSETRLDTNDGVYQHPVEGPYNDVYEQIAADDEFSKLVWYRVINDIDPYETPVFRNPSVFLKPAVVYSCSCPAYSQAILRMPQTTEMEGTRKVNRQRQYPLPTAQGRGDYESVGLDSAAGVLQSWANPAERLSYKLCKHTISSMFHDRLKLQEPNTYQTISARRAFEAKLIEDVAQTKEMFTASYERGGISTIEVVFALAQGLNLDEVETAFVVLNSRF